MNTSTPKSAPVLPGRLVACSSSTTRFGFNSCASAFAAYTPLSPSGSRKQRRGVVRGGVLARSSTFGTVLHPPPAHAPKLPALLTSSSSSSSSSFSSTVQPACRSEKVFSLTPRRRVPLTAGPGFLKPRRSTELPFVTTHACLASSSHNANASSSTASMATTTSDPRNDDIDLPFVSIEFAATMGRERHQPTISPDDHQGPGGNACIDGDDDLSSVGASSSVSNNERYDDFVLAAPKAIFQHRRPKQNHDEITDGSCSKAQKLRIALPQLLPPATTIVGSSQPQQQHQVIPETAKPGSFFTPNGRDLRTPSPKSITIAAGANQKFEMRHWTAAMHDKPPPLKYGCLSLATSTSALSPRTYPAPPPTSQSPQQEDNHFASTQGIVANPAPTKEAHLLVPRRPLKPRGILPGAAAIGLEWQVKQPKKRKRVGGDDNDGDEDDDGVNVVPFNILVSFSPDAQTEDFSTT